MFTRSKPLYLITDTKIAGLSHIQIARRAIAAGISVIQLREKNMSKKDFYREALSVRKLTLQHKTRLIVNDYIDIALAVNADGIHIGQEDMPLEEARKIMGKGKIVGVSTHSLKEALRAEDGGADYIGFGPLFLSGTKDAGHPKGIKALQHVRRYVRIPVVAIGGITWDNIHNVLKAGADAAAVVSGILSGDIKNNVKRFMTALKACT